MQDACKEPIGSFDGSEVGLYLAFLSAIPVYVLQGNHLLFCVSADNIC